MKKIFAIILVLLFCMSGSAEPSKKTHNETFVCGEYEYALLEGGAARIRAYYGQPVEKLVIPSELDGYRVTEIGDGVFGACTRLEEVTLPDSLEMIGKSAFSGCRFLKKVVMPDSLTVIGRYAFYDCDDLCEITFPDNLTSIESYAFYDCYRLNGITLPDSLQSIGENPFMNCFSLDQITVSPAHPVLETIDGVLFSKPDKRLITYPMGFQNNSYTVPYGTQEIGEGAFCKCKNLREINFPDSLILIDVGAFSECNDLSEVVLPESVVTIGKAAFSACSYLEKINLPSSVTMIGDDILFKCPNLNEIIVEQDSYAMEYCISKGLPYIIAED